jgi:hypothetical protein
MGEADIPFRGREPPLRGEMGLPQRGPLRGRAEEAKIQSSGQAACTSRMLPTAVLETQPPFGITGVMLDPDRVIYMVKEFFGVYSLLARRPVLGRPNFREVQHATGTHSAGRECLALAS